MFDELKKVNYFKKEEEEEEKKKQVQESYNVKYF